MKCQVVSTARCEWTHCRQKCSGDCTGCLISAYRTNRAIQTPRFDMPRGLCTIGSDSYVLSPGTALRTTALGMLGRTTGALRSSGMLTGWFGGFSLRFRPTDGPPWLCRLWINVRPKAALILRRLRLIIEVEQAFQERGLLIPAVGLDAVGYRYNTGSLDKA